MNPAEADDAIATELTAACVAAEESFQRGEPGDRALAEAAVAASIAHGRRELEARARQVLAEVDYDRLAYPAALAGVEIALALREDLLGSDDMRTRYSRLSRAVALTGLEREDEADRDLALAMKGRAAPTSAEDAALNARFWVGAASAYAGRKGYAEARPFAEAVIAAEPTGLVPPLSLANACLQLSGVYEGAGQSPRAARLLERTIAIRRAHIGEPSLRVALALLALGISQLRGQRTEESCATLHAAAAMVEAAGQAEHPRASGVYIALATAELVSGHGQASEPWLTRAVALETKTFGAAHPATGTMLLAAATSYASRELYGRAAELAQEAAAVFLPHVERHRQSFDDAVGRGFACLRELKRDEAIVRWIEPMVTTLERRTPPADRALAPALNMLGEAYAALGKMAKAEAAMRRSLALAHRIHGEASSPVHGALVNLGILLSRQRRTGEARAIEERAARVAAAMEDRSHGPLLGFRQRGLA